MSALSNNIDFHVRHGDSPQPTVSNVVLSSISLKLSAKNPDAEQYSSLNVLSSISLKLSAKNPNPDQYSSNYVLRSMSLGYYGWKYLQEPISELITRNLATIIHHK